MGIKEKKEIDNNREIKDDTRKARRFCENTTIKRAVVERPHDKSRDEETRQDGTKRNKSAAETAARYHRRLFARKKKGKREAKIKSRF